MWPWNSDKTCTQEGKDTGLKITFLRSGKAILHGTVKTHSPGFSYELTPGPASENAVHLSLKLAAPGFGLAAESELSIRSEFECPSATKEVIIEMQGPYKGSGVQTLRCIR